MLANLKDLFAVLAALYLLESVIRVRAAHPTFVSDLRGRFRLAAPGFQFISILPWARAHRSRPLGMRLGDRGVYLLSPEGVSEGRHFEREAYRLVRYETLPALSAENESVRLGEELWARFPSPPAARSFVESLRAVSSTARREDAVTENESWATDPDSLSALAAKVSEPIALLDRLGAGLFLALGVVFPAGVYGELFDGSGLWVWLAVVLILQCGIALSAWRLWRRLRQEGIDLDGSALVPIFFFPPSAMRASSGLTRDLYVRFDYLTVGQALLPPDRFLKLAGRELYGARHALSSSAEKDWQSLWRGRVQHVHGLLRRAGLSREDALRLGERSDPTAASRCPLCEDEYLARDGLCVDCGVELVAFEDQPSASGSNEEARLSAP